MRKSATACGMRRPEATVLPFCHSSAAHLPSSNALTIGAQPAAWTETMRGRRFRAKDTDEFRVRADVTA